MMVAAALAGLGVGNSELVVTKDRESEVPTFPGKNLAVQELFGEVTAINGAKIPIDETDP